MSKECFIEVYESSFGKQTQAVYADRDQLNRSLKHTANCEDVKTVCVWKVKEKFQPVIVSHDKEVDVLIVEPA